MKKYLSAIALASALTLAGCNSMFNDEPYNKVAETTVWHNPLLLDEYVNGWYDGMSDGFNTYVYSTIALMKSASRYNMVWFADQVSVGKTDWFNAGYGDLLKSNETEISNWASMKWSNSFSQIQNINTLLENASEIPEGDQKQRVLGEAHFLRAYYYYMLWRYYGAPPIINHTFNPLENAEKFPRASYDEVVKFIVAEADAAANLLPVKYSSTDAGRATKGAAIMLKAKTYLWAASPIFQNKDREDIGFKEDRSEDMLNAAKTAYEDLFGLKTYDLVPVSGSTEESIAQSYRKIFLTKNSIESIFEVQHADDGNFSTKNGHRLDREAAAPFFTGTTASYTPTHNHVMEYGMQQGYTYDASNPYAHRDYRFYANVLYDGAMFRGHEMDIHYTNNVAGVDLTAYGTSTSAAFSRTGYYCAKFMDESTVIDNNDTYASSQNYIIWRLAEAKLDYAEVLFRLGKPELTQLALKEVNDIRRRAHMHELTSLSWDELVNERRVEMAFEETTYWDILRWGIAEERLNGTSNPLKAVRVDINNGVKKFTISNLNRFPGRVRVWKTKQYYLPIPWSEIRYHGFKQNPGWDEV